MRGVLAATAERLVEGPSAPRVRRLVPPAVTPLRTADLTAGVVAQGQGTGRQAFRDTIRDHLDAATVPTYTSFRRALCACLRALAETDDGRTVLVPAFCSQDYAAAIEGADLTLRRYDVDPATLAADPDSIRDRDTDDALALLVASPLGYASSMDELDDLCTDLDVRLIEAVGYSLGSAYDGRPIGSFGDCAVLNFQQGKPIPVGGGAVATGDASLPIDGPDRPAVAPNVATLAGYACFGRPRAYGLYADVVKPLYHRLADDDHVSTHPEPKTGVAYEPPFAAMSHFQCAVADRVFDRREAYRRQRARTAAVYRDALADCPGIDLPEPVPGLSAHQHVRFPILAESEALRRDIRSELDDIGVQAGRLYDWPPLDADRFPGAAAVQRGILTLPTHPYVTDRDRERIVSGVRSVAGSGTYQQ